MLSSSWLLLFYSGRLAHAQFSRYNVEIAGKLIVYDGENEEQNALPKGVQKPGLGGCTGGASLNCIKTYVPKNMATTDLIQQKAEKAE